MAAQDNYCALKGHKHSTYLGIKIGQTPESLYHLNYPRLISKMLKELEGWGKLPLSLFGWITSGMIKYIWQGKRLRVEVAKLYLPKRDGGGGLPNIRV